jgi:hypothetical protein
MNRGAALDALQAETDTLQHPQIETVQELAALLPANLDLTFTGEL